MRKKLEWKWQALDEGTRRVKVLGGWLVNTHRHRNEKNLAMDQALVFIADRNHTWEIAAPKTDLQLEALDLAKEFEVDGA